MGREIVGSETQSLADAARQAIERQSEPARVPLADAVEDCPPHWWLVQSGGWTCRKCGVFRRGVQDVRYRDGIRGANTDPRRRVHDDE